MPHAPLVVIGNANVDLTTYLERAPEVGETVLGHNFSIGRGGKGANQAVAAARAGAEVSFIGRIGEDAFGASGQQTGSAHQDKKQRSSSVSLRICVPAGGLNTPLVNLG